MVEYQTQNIKRENVIFDDISKFCLNSRNNFNVLYINVHKLQSNVATVSNKKAINDILMPPVKNGVAKVFIK